ncbi:hypothetical protein FHQ08_06205 [Lactobacillus sp. CC-MHH1034]|uniref:ComGF family competence protein n=1 Tax=Agrilactobacillus fermenti TaxID=2586909 RepID=UPI001E5BE566|nr:ComGF family competence protein [Agrilactobacillus fermenti]MCD2256310.1 hypothetical protein [Agrilactobacillus fermenti]
MCSKQAAFTLVEMVLSLFVLCCCVILIQTTLLAKHHMEIATLSTQESWRVRLACIQLDHYLERCEFVSINLVNEQLNTKYKSQELRIWHHDKNTGVGELREVAPYYPKNSNGKLTILLQNFESKGYMPLLENCRQMRFEYHQPYILMRIRMASGQDYQYQLFCPKVRSSSS